VYDANEAAERAGIRILSHQDLLANGIDQFLTDRLPTRSSLDRCDPRRRVGLYLRAEPVLVEERPTDLPELTKPPETAGAVGDRSEE
jgi:hypothetical protein